MGSLALQQKVPCWPECQNKTKQKDDGDRTRTCEDIVHNLSKIAL